MRIEKDGVSLISQSAYNRFDNLDSIEERIINHLIKSNTIYAQRIWKLLKYPDVDALLKPDLTQEEKSKLVDDNGADQENKRVFRYPFLEDAFNSECSILRVYIDSVVPTNHLNSIVNVGLDLIVHNKCNNVYNDSNDDVEGPELYRHMESEIIIKSRKSVFLKNILAELNGLDIAGVGQLQFSRDTSVFSQARLGYFNNRDYSGYKIVIPCMQSGVR